MKKTKSLLLIIFTVIICVVSWPPDETTRNIKQMATKWDNLGIISAKNWIVNYDTPILRSELSVVLDNIMKFQEESENIFGDSEEEWYLEYMLKTYRAGLIIPSNEQLEPYSTISREEAIVILAKALCMGVSSSQDYSGYYDNDNIDTASIPYIRAMKDSGYLPFQDRLYPDKAITKGEILEIMSLSIGTIYNTAGLYDKSIDSNLVINTADVTLKNVTINGNLIISEGVSQGEINLDEVHVTGRTVVRGASTVHAINSNLGEIVVNNLDGDTDMILDENSISSSLLVSSDYRTLNFTGNTSLIDLYSEEGTLNLINTDASKIDLYGKKATLNIDEDSNSSAVYLLSNESTANVLGVAKSVYVDQQASDNKIYVTENSLVSYLSKKVDSTVIGESYIQDISVLTGYEVYLGGFTSTAYCTENYPHICNNGNAATTATGTAPLPYKTIAVDPSVIPLGTKLKVEDSLGNVYFVTATDTGGAIKGHKIDMVTPTHDDAILWGKRNVNIWAIY